MKHAPNNSTATPRRTQSWLPATTSVLAVDPNHWQSRAARGLTWNRDGAGARRRPH